MSNETDKMNYCCDCGWAIRKGFIFKKWYCTCPEIMEKLKKVEISPVNGIKTIEKEKKIECTNLRGTFAYSHLERMPDGRKFCKNYKEKFKGGTYTLIGWWGMQPKPTCPPRRSRNPIPALPERTERTTQEHDAAYLMNQKQKELEAENKRLRFLITEIREFLVGGAIPGKIRLKQECIREIYTIAHQEDQKRMK